MEWETLNFCRTVAGLTLAQVTHTHFAGLSPWFKWGGGEKGVALQRPFVSGTLARLKFITRNCGKALFSWAGKVPVVGGPAGEGTAVAGGGGGSPGTRFPDWFGVQKGEELPLFGLVSLKGLEEGYGAGVMPLSKVWKAE